MASPQVDAPIFIVGAPRSGTSVFYERLGMHPDLAWISNITKKAPTSRLLTRALMLVRRDHYPAEAKNVWGHLRPRDDDSLTARDVTPRACRRLHKVVRNNLALFGKPRFVCKAPGNSLRIGFLNAVFSDAHFVHVVRDGRAVAASILRNRRRRNGAWWGTQPPGWRELDRRPLAEACGQHWKLIVEHALRAAEAVPPERHVLVRYEDFCDGPRETLTEAAQACGLTWQPEDLERAADGISSRNFKWRDELTDEEVSGLNDELGDLLTRLGYEV